MSIVNETTASPPARHPHRAAIAALGFVAFIYIACLALMPHDGAAFWSPDEGGKFIQLQNLRLDPGFDISINYPGKALDSDYNFVPFPPRESFVHDGRLYLQWPPFLPLLTWLPFKLFGGLGLYLLPCLAGLATLWFAYLLTRLLIPSAARAWVVIPLLGLTTPLFAYSLVYFEHTIAALLVTLTLYALLRAIYTPQGQGMAVGWGWMLLSGLALAAAIWLRSELYILAAVIVGMLTLRAILLGGWRKVGVWLGGLLASLIPLWLFYIFTWGSLLPAHATPYFSSGLKARFIAAGGIRTFLGSFLLGVPDDLTASPDLGPHLASGLRLAFLLGLATFLLGAMLRSGWLRDTLLLLGFAALLAISTIVLLDGEDYSALHGFLLPTPLLAIAALLVRPTIFRAYPPNETQPPTRRHSTFYILHSTFSTPLPLFAAITALYVAAHTLIISIVSGLGPDSRFEWGQRYLLPAYPLVAVLVVVALPRLWLNQDGDERLRIGGSLLRDLLALVLLLALVVSVGLEVRGVAAISAARQSSVTWTQTVRQTTRQTPNVPIVSNIWWLPLRVGGVYNVRRLYLAEDADQLAAFARQMKGAGQGGFWLLTTDAQPPTIAGATATTNITASVAGVEMIRYSLKLSGSRLGCRLEELASTPAALAAGVGPAIHLPPIQPTCLLRPADDV